MELNAPEVQEKLNEWEEELRRLTGNFRVALSAHIEPIKNSDVTDLITVVCEETGIEIGRIRTRTRKREVVIARHLLVYFGRCRCGLSWSELGGLIGGKDHSTAIHANQSIQALLDTKDITICFYVKQIEKRLILRNNVRPN